MPWRDKLKQLKHEWDNLTSQPLQNASQQPANQPEPYWKPVFEPTTLVNDEWELKVGNGNDGWGNQEMQHYSADAANSFHTQDNSLVLRAIAYSSAHKPEQRFTSARLVSKRTLGRDRGVLTGVIQSPCADGVWPAFWLLPKEPFTWPDDGEIDISETWNGDHENKSCLHWGHHHEPQKHRVLKTKIHDMSARPVRYDFAWDQPGGKPGHGRLMWYIDGKPVMKMTMEGKRPIKDFTILLNIAMGGNVCGGKVPADGQYDMVVHDLHMADDLAFGGWARFEADWGNQNTPMGNTY